MTSLEGIGVNEVGDMQGTETKKMMCNMQLNVHGNDMNGMEGMQGTNKNGPNKNGNDKQQDNPDYNSNFGSNLGTPARQRNAKNGNDNLGAMYSNYSKIKSADYGAFSEKKDKKWVDTSNTKRNAIAGNSDLPRQGWNIRNNYNNRGGGGGGDTNRGGGGGDHGSRSEHKQNRPDNAGYEGVPQGRNNSGYDRRNNSNYGNNDGPGNRNKDGCGNRNNDGFGGRRNSYYNNKHDHDHDARGTNNNSSNNNGWNSNPVIIKGQKITGTVKFFLKSTGYGFLIGPDGREAFVHENKIIGNPLARHDTVTYELDRDAGTGRLIAINVEGGTGGAYEIFGPPDAQHQRWMDWKMSTKYPTLVEDEEPKKTRKNKGDRRADKTRHDAKGKKGGEPSQGFLNLAELVDTPNDKMKHGMENLAQIDCSQADRHTGIFAPIDQPIFSSLPQRSDAKVDPLTSLTFALNQAKANGTGGPQVTAEHAELFIGREVDPKRIVKDHGAEYLAHMSDQRIQEERLNEQRTQEELMNEQQGTSQNGCQEGGVNQNVGMNQNGCRSLCPPTTLSLLNNLGINPNILTGGNGNDCLTGRYMLGVPVDSIQSAIAFRPFPDISPSMTNNMCGPFPGMNPGSTTSVNPGFNNRGTTNTGMDQNPGMNPNPVNNNSVMNGLMHSAQCGAPLLNMPSANMHSAIPDSKLNSRLKATANSFHPENSPNTNFAQQTGLLQIETFEQQQQGQGQAFQQQCNNVASIIDLQNALINTVNGNMSNGSMGNMGSGNGNMGQGNMNAGNPNAGKMGIMAQDLDASSGNLTNTLPASIMNALFLQHQQNQQMSQGQQNLQMNQGQQNNMMQAQQQNMGQRQQSDFLNSNVNFGFLSDNGQDAFVNALNLNAALVNANLPNGNVITNGNVTPISNVTPMNGQNMSNNATQCSHGMQSNNGMINGNNRCNMAFSDSNSNNGNLQFASFQR